MIFIGKPEPESLIKWGMRSINPHYVLEVCSEH
jgi:hypothetical protein